jgi:hypothetical protein
MFERDESSFGATPALRIRERALETIALPHPTRDLERHVARALSGLSTLAWPTSPQTSFHFTLQQRIEGALEEQSEIAAGNRVTE